MNHWNTGPISPLDKQFNPCKKSWKLTVGNIQETRQANRRVGYNTNQSLLILLIFSKISILYAGNKVKRRQDFAENSSDN